MLREIVHDDTMNERTIALAWGVLTRVLNHWQLPSTL